MSREHEGEGDRHADTREEKRHKKRYGPKITNPGMRIVMRDLAHKAHRRDGGDPDDGSERPVEDVGPEGDRSR